MTLLELAEKVLKETGKPLTPVEIWQYAEAKSYTSLLNASGKTPWQSIGAQLYVGVRDNPHGIFKGTETRPKRFYIKGLVDEKTLEGEDVSGSHLNTIQKAKLSYLEKDLHSVLVYYAFYHLRCYTKTIHHVVSSKKEFGEWVHPDVVGCYFPIDDWKSEVYELSTAIGNNAIRLLSFELKRSISFANLRESFFQTVSNSSWANESYLVAAEISEDADFITELSRLSSSFGVGVIRLDIKNPEDSELKLPARFREALDWETINKLTTLNSDFKEFVTRIKIDLTSKKIHKKEYDAIESTESLKKKFSSGV